MSSNNSPNGSTKPIDLSQWLRQSIKPTYMWYKSTKEDVKAALKVFPNIRPRMAPFASDNGHIANMLCLDLTLVPEENHMKSLSFRMSVWIPPNYPSGHPIARLCPEPGLVPRPSSFFSQQGEFTHLALQTWKDNPKKSIVSFLQLLMACVANSPPFALPNSNGPVPNSSALQFIPQSQQVMSRPVSVGYHSQSPVQQQLYPAQAPLPSMHQPFYQTRVVPVTAVTPQQQYYTPQSSGPIYRTDLFAPQPSAPSAPHAAANMHQPSQQSPTESLPPPYSESQIPIYNEQIRPGNYSLVSSASSSIAHMAPNQIPRSASDLRVQLTHVISPENTLAQPQTQSIPSAPPALEENIDEEEEEERLVFAS